MFVDSIDILAGSFVVFCIWNTAKSAASAGPLLPARFRKDFMALSMLDCAGHVALHIGVVKYGSRRSMDFYKASERWQYLAVSLWDCSGLSTPNAMV